MRKSHLLATLVLAVVVGNPASAITGRFVRDFNHPFVGLAVFYDSTGEFIGRCSGSLLSPTLFLTAGHCIEGATSARVYFQQDAGAHYDPVTEIDPVSKVGRQMVSVTVFGGSAAALAAISESNRAIETWR